MISQKVEVNQKCKLSANLNVLRNKEVPNMLLRKNLTSVSEQWFGPAFQVQCYRLDTIPSQIYKYVFYDYLQFPGTCLWYLFTFGASHECCTRCSMHFGFRRILFDPICTPIFNKFYMLSVLELDRKFFADFYSGDAAPHSKPHHQQQKPPT